MDKGEKKTQIELPSLLETLPPVDFCCIYGSTFHPNNSDKTSMVDYILGVGDPWEWHADNLKMNRIHYASLLVRLGGPRLITNISDGIGVGVHFTPFVFHNNQLFKYGVVGMHHLLKDIMSWESFFLSGRMQKPVNIIVDNIGVEKHNSKINLKAAAAAAFLLLPSTFSEEQLYSKICNLSYMGDLRMLFAEDKNKVKKIVEGQFNLFQRMYKPLLEEFAALDLCRFSSSVGRTVNIIQDCGIPTTSSLVSTLPSPVRKNLEIELGEVKVDHASDGSVRNVAIKSKERAAECLLKILRRKVMISSARQAVAGFMTAGAVHGLRYLEKKMQKAWRS